MTLSAFGAFGFAAPKITVDSSGEDVRVVMSPQQACTARPSTEANLDEALRRGMPWLRSIRLVVGQSGQGLSQYVRAHCRPVALPGGRGRVVLTQAGGPGLNETDEFTIRSDRWTVEYINGARVLQVIVMKGGLPSGASVVAAKRGPGRKTLKGAGRYTLQVATSGEWVIRVRDGA